MSTGGEPLFDQRYLALCGIVAPVLFAVGVVVAGLSWDGYSHATQNISDLGGTGAPRPAIQNVTFVMGGVLVAGLAVGLRRDARAGRGPILVGGLGVAMVVMGAFPCTPGCAEGTVSDVVHGLAALAGFLAFAVGTFLLSRRMRGLPGWTSLVGYTAVTGIATLVGLVAWFVVSGVDHEALYGGAVQRAFVTVVFVWIGVAGVRLFRLAERKGASSGPSGAASRPPG